MNKNVDVFCLAVDCVSVSAELVYHYPVGSTQFSKRKLSYLFSWDSNYLYIEFNSNQSNSFWVYSMQTNKLSDILPFYDITVDIAHAYTLPTNFLTKIFLRNTVFHFYEFYYCSWGPARVFHKVFQCCYYNFSRTWTLFALLCLCHDVKNVLILFNLLTKI